MSATEERWVLCPVCGAKTRLRLLRRTILQSSRSSARNAAGRASSTQEIFKSKKSISQTQGRSADHV